MLPIHPPNNFYCVICSPTYCMYHMRPNNMYVAYALQQPVCIICIRTTSIYHMRYHGEYRFPKKVKHYIQGLFQGQFRSFQGLFQCRSRCITVKKYRVTRLNLEFPCDLLSTHKSFRTGRWNIFFRYFCTFSLK